MKAKLLTFPTIPKGRRLAERARIVAENFQNPVYGTPLMLYIIERMYDTFNTEDIDWQEMQILAKLHELSAYLEMYEKEEGSDSPSE